MNPQPKAISFAAGLAHLNWPMVADFLMPDEALKVSNIAQAKALVAAIDAIPWYRGHYRELRNGEFNVIKSKRKKR